MPENNLDLDAAVVRTYDVLVGGTDLGWIEDPTVKITPKLLERKAQPLGDLVLGHRVIGLDVRIAAVLKEIKSENLARCFPWGDEGEVSLIPTALNGDLYEFAQELILHPRDMGVVTTQDIVLLKAVAIGGLDLKGEGAKEAGIPVEWTAYPDRGELPDIILGRIGR